MRGKAKPQGTPIRIIPQGELGAWLLAGLVFLFLAGWAWILKGPSAEQAAGDPGLLSDYFKGHWSGWTPQYLLGRSESILNVGFLALQSIGLIQLVSTPLLGELGGIKLAGLLFAGTSGLSMYFFVTSLTPNKKTAALAGFLYVTMPAIIVRAVMYEHIGVSMAFVFVPLLLRGLWVLTQVRSPREVVLLGLSAAGLSLSYTKMAVTMLPILAAWSLFCLSQARVGKLRVLVSYLLAGGVASLAGLSILLPAFHESRIAALFAFDPLEGWQKHYSFKTALAWIDLSKFFLAGAGPDFEGDAQFFFIGAVPLAAVSLGLGWGRLAAWRESREGRFFLILSFCWLLSLWLAAGPRGILGNQLYFLSSAQGMLDFSLPLIWLIFLLNLWMVWRVLCGLTHGSRVIPVAGLLLFTLAPAFTALSKAPLFGDIRGPESFWSIGGAACLVASVALVAVPLLTLPNSSERTWRPLLFPAIFLVYLIHFLPVYQAFGKGGLDPALLQDYERAADFLKNAPREGRVHPMSSRYYYLTIPEKTGRGLSTEALLRHFQLKWVRHFEVASQASMELFQKYLNLAGVSYLLIDKSDPSIPPQAVEAYRQVFPPVFESNHISILENRGSMFPAFFAKDFVVYPGSSYLQSPAILQLSGLNFLAVEATSPDPNTPGLAGLAKGEGEVELTPAYRDRPGTPFLPVSMQAPRNSDFGRINFNFPPGHGGGWLAVTEAWHPDWKVVANGAIRPATRVAAALLGARIEPGETSVEFRFQPPGWYMGALGVGIITWISMIGFLILAPMRWVPSGFQAWWRGGDLDLDEDQPRVSAKDLGKRAVAKPIALDKIQKVLVILPTYNEGETIQHVLEEVQAKMPGVEILVVDDNPSIGSAAKVRQTPNFGKKVHLLEWSGKDGLGSAYKDGFQWALKRGYDAVVGLDIGLAYDPADLTKLLQVLTEGADIAVGSRYLNGVRVLNWPQSRLWMSLCAAMAVRMLTGLPMTDPASGFHAIRRRVLEGLGWDQAVGPDPESPIEIHFRAWQGGFRLQEVPIVFTERRGGQSSISWKMAWGTAWRVLTLAVRRVFP